MSGLDRFLAAQVRDYDTALAEIKSGRKRSHWMWYIFPQLAGLGMTEISRHYAIRDLGEAAAYLKHPTLGGRLILLCEALLALESDDAHAIFGSPDDLKLRSSMTLFNAVPGAPGIFQQVLDKFYQGESDEKTLALLNK